MCHTGCSTLQYAGFVCTPASDSLKDWTALHALSPCSGVSFEMSIVTTICIIIVTIILAIIITENDRDADSAHVGKDAHLIRLHLVVRHDEGRAVLSSTASSCHYRYHCQRLCFTLVTISSVWVLLLVLFDNSTHDGAHCILLMYIAVLLYS